MDTFADIINGIGGPAAFGRAIGITTERAAEMRRRGSIPPEYWPQVVTASSGTKAEGVTIERLAAMRAERRSQSEGVAA